MSIEALDKIDKAELRLHALLPKRLENKMKILLADDHPLFREGMHYLLEALAEDVVLLEAGNLYSALEHLKLYPDIELILLDLAMPGMEGGAGLHTLMQYCADIPVVMLSASESPADIERLLDAGAAGYIPKSFTSEKMLEAIRQVLAGQVYIPPLVSLALPDASDRLTDTLSARQLEVLKLMGTGLCNKSIARKLDISENTVKQHVRMVFKVLKVSNRVEAVLKMNNDYTPSRHLPERHKID